MTHVLEMADSDLKKLFRQAIFLTDMHVRTLLYNLLVGVKFLHSAGVYHRDLKPANCLVHQDCSIKICDFGLSRAVGMEKEIEKSIFTEKLAKKENSLVGDDDNEGSKSRKHRGLRRQLTGHIVTRWYRSPEVIFVQDAYDEGVDVWSVGCIFAELLGMLKEVVSFPSDRGPLFPGSTCFPLSPDRKHVSDYKFHARGNKDQLNMIFNVIGTPSDEDVASFEEKDIREYLRCFTKRSGMGIPEVFKAAASDASNLLERMLVFNHKRRITVEECLRHKYLAGVRGVEIVAKDQVFLPFELEPSLDEKDLRQHFISEIQKFHPE
ncbi:MAPK2, putative, partial [Perkinsus marinus ATCC 50983]